MLQFKISQRNYPIPNHHCSLYNTQTIHTSKTFYQNIYCPLKISSPTPLSDCFVVSMMIPRHLYHQCQNKCKERERHSREMEMMVPMKVFKAIVLRSRDHQRFTTQTREGEERKTKRTDQDALMVKQCLNLLKKISQGPQKIKFRKRWTCEFMKTWAERLNLCSI